MIGKITLEEAKRRVSRRLLGHHGVHGVGCDRSRQEVVLWLKGPASGLPAEARREAEELGWPFRISVRNKPRPVLLYSSDAAS